MIARFSSPEAGNRNSVELLKLEYQECQSGYNNRDRLVPQEFSFVVLIFAGLTAVLGFLVNTLDYSKWLIATIIIVGLLGLGGLISFLVDIQSNLSCKRALRKRSEEIENLLSPNVTSNENPPLCIWRIVIPDRKPYQYCTERWFKSVQRKLKLPNYFVLACYIAIILWVILTIFAGIHATNIPTPQESTPIP
jgi:small-conductance mechanosensitive channel